MISHSSPPVMASKPFWLVIFTRFLPLLVVQAIFFTLIVAQKPSKNCLDCLIKNHIYNYERRSDFALLWNRELQESINETCRENLTCLPQALEQFLEKTIVDCSGDSTIDCLDYALTLQFGKECRSQTQRGNIFRFWAHSTFSPCFQADSIPPQVEPELTTTVDMIPSQVIDSECLRCICSASTDCDLNATCTDNRCGPYMISRDQYEKADQPGESFNSCASSKNCSELVLQRFMAKNAQDCNNDGTINCEDFAAFHKFGFNCNDNRLRSTNFWYHFEYCTIMADDVRREPNPWDNSGIRSNYSADSVPPLVVPPILFNSVPAILTTTLDSGINQIISIDYNCFNCIQQVMFTMIRPSTLVNYMDAGHS
ncbi:uncharacterized protein LOC141854693 isoform X2 [Brevipalpus obovatus]|uniref:uncharacterized protein LOC141854693 isoform X2 n=1 Tax=Brevipalpus obovatus TaxID=246614 RepID=UPI003D9E4C66